MVALKNNVRNTYNLQTKLVNLMESEHASLARRKRLHVQLVCGADGVLTGCQMDGSIGKVVMSNVSDMALPGDQYELRVSVVDEAGSPFPEAPRVVCTGSGEVYRLGVSMDDPTSVVMMTKEVENVRVLCAVSAGRELAVSFDTCNIAEATCWLADTGNDAGMVDVELSRLFSGDGILLRARDMAPTVSWVNFESTLHDLHNRLGRVQALKERVVGRYVAAHDDGWYGLFGNPAHVDLSRSELRVSTLGAYRQTDLTAGVKAVQDVDECLEQSRHERLASSIGEIVDNLCSGAVEVPAWMKERHKCVLEELVQMRGETVGTLREWRALERGGEHLESRLMSRKNVWNERERCVSREKGGFPDGVVETRARYLVLSAIDAGLRWRVGMLCNVDGERERAELDVKFSRFQLGQVYANNVENDIQLSQAGYESAVAQVDTVLSLCQKTTGAPNVHDMMPFQLMRRLCQTRILESLARVHPGAPDISQRLNFVYSQDYVRGERRDGVAVVQNCHQRFMEMIAADHQNRLLTPLLYRYLVRVGHASHSTLKREVDNGKLELVIGLFESDVQPLVRKALTGEGNGGEFEFLDDLRPRTGYNYTNKTKLLVQLLFAS